MRPAIIRLIAGGALGIAFSVSLMLPGALVFPENEPVRHFASPRVPAPTVVRAAPNVLRTQKAPAPQPVVVRKVSVPAARPVPAARVVRHVPSRSTPSPRPRKRRPTPPAEQRLTPLTATPSQPTSAEQPKKAKEPKKPKKDGPLSGETKTKKPKKPKKPKKDEPRSGERKTKKEKGKDEGDYEGGEQERGGDKGEGRDEQRKGRDDEGGDRGDYGNEG